MTKEDKLRRMMELQEKDAQEMAQIIEAVRGSDWDPNAACEELVGGAFALSAATAEYIREADQPDHVRPLPAEILKNDNFIDKMGDFYEARNYLERTGIPFQNYLQRVQQGTWILY